MVNLNATLLTLILVAICVTIHYETLYRLSRLTQRPGSHRWLVLISVYGALVAHVVEIWVYGLGYWFASRYELGVIETIRSPFDYVYYSAMVYTTVGFGDLVPTGGIRMISSSEALIGLALITWTASFTYLQMQRLWRD